MTSTTMAASPQLTLHPRPTARQRLTSRVKSLALAHGLSVSAVTSAEAFPEVFTILRDRIDAGHMAGMDWFTTERAAASCDPKTLMANPLSILSVGVAYWGSDDGKPEDGVPRGRISRYARGVDYHQILQERMRGAARGYRGDGRTARCGPVPDRSCPDRRSRGRGPRPGSAGTARTPASSCPGTAPGSCSASCCSISTSSRTSHWPRTADAAASASIAARRERSSPRTRSTRRRASRFRRSSSAARSRASCDRTSATGSSAATSARRSAPTPAPPRRSRTRPSFPGTWTTPTPRCTACWRCRTGRSASDTGERPSCGRGGPGWRAMRRSRSGTSGPRTTCRTLTRAALGHDLALVRGHAAWALGRIGGSRARRALARAWERERDAEARAEIALALEEAA